MKVKLAVLSIISILSVIYSAETSAAIPQRESRHVIPGQDSVKSCQEKTPDWSVHFGRDFGFSHCVSDVSNPPHRVYEQAQPKCALPCCNDTHIKHKFSRWNRENEYLILDAFYPNLETIKIEADINTFTLRANGIFPSLRNIFIDTSICWCKRLCLDLIGDFVSTDMVEITGKSDNLELNLRGRWGHNCTVKVRSQSESVHISLPSQTGVKIKTSTGAKITSTEELTTRSREEFTNQAYGKAPVTLTIDLTWFRGKIIVE
jgi:hypothetical protein